MISSIRRGRSSIVAALAVLALTGAVAGCSSGSDDAATDPAPATAVPDSLAGSPDVTTVDAVDDTTPMTESTADIGDAGDGSDSSDAECGGLSAAEVGAAIGVGDFTTANDIASEDDQTSCLFGNPTAIYGATVTSQSAASYLGGELDGASIDEALSTLETTLGFALEEPTANRVTIGGNDAIVVTGMSVVGGATGSAGTVVDGVLYIVDADGADLAADPAGFEPIVTNLLTLALTKN